MEVTDERKALAIAKYKKLKERPVLDTLVEGILRGGLAGGISGGAVASVPAAVCMLNHDSFKNQDTSKDKPKHIMNIGVSALLGGVGGSLIGGLIGGGSALAKKEDAAYQLSKLLPKEAAAKDYLIGGLAGAGIGAGGGMLANIVLGKSPISKPLVFGGMGIGAAAGLAVGHQQAKFRTGENISDTTRKAITKKDESGRDVFYVNRGQDALTYGEDGKMHNRDGSVYMDDGKEVMWSPDSPTLYTVGKDDKGNDVRKTCSTAHKRYNNGIYLVSTREVPITEALGKPSNKKIDEGVPGLKNIFTHAACIAISDKPFEIKTPFNNEQGYVIRKARRDLNGQYYMEFGLTAYPDTRAKYKGVKGMLMPKWTGPYVNHEQAYLMKKDDGTVGYIPASEGYIDDNPKIDDGAPAVKALRRIVNGDMNPSLQVMSISDPNTDMNPDLMRRIMDDYSEHMMRYPEGYGPYNVVTPPFSAITDGNPYRNCHEWIIGWLRHIAHKKFIDRKATKYLASNPFPALAGNWIRSDRAHKTFFPEDFE